MSGALPAVREEANTGELAVDEAVDRAVRDIAALLAAEPGGVRHLPGATVRRIRTAEAVYHVRGSLIGGDRRTVLVVVERREPEPPSEEALRRLFGLTKKEATVARLLAYGRSNSEIAEALGISRHTARHHTENVMLKLRVRNRTHVRTVLHEAACAEA